MQRVFHPPYDRVTVVLLIGGIVGFGWGSMWYGVVHQQVRFPFALFVSVIRLFLHCHFESDK